MNDVAKILTVRVANHYGRTTVYPVCDLALLFTCIAGTKTLTQKSLRLIKELGYEIEVQAPTLEVANG